MVEWNIVAIIILVIALILVGILVVKLTGGAKNWVEAAFDYVKDIICSKLGWAKWLSPICW